VTNFVIFRAVRDRAAFLEALAGRGVLMVPYPHDTVRAVTHYGVERADIEATVAAVRATLAETAGTRPAVGAGAAAATGAWTRPVPVGAPRA
jgi:hypothetical protein